MIAFASLADFELTKGPRSIERQDRMSTVTVFANTEASEVQTVGYEMRDRMDAIPLPRGIVGRWIDDSAIWLQKRAKRISL